VLVVDAVRSLQVIVSDVVFLGVLLGMVCAQRFDSLLLGLV